MEQQDQTLGSHTSDKEDEDFHTPVDVEAKLAEAQSEEDEMEFGVRARRKNSDQGSRSSVESRSSCPPLRVRLSQYSRNSHIKSDDKKKRTRTYQKSTNGTLRKKVSLWSSFSDEIQRVS